jgi:signal transduction histidine kinase
VRLCARHDGETFIFEVQDTGIGIAPEHIGLLFRDFSQVDASSARRYVGTGLGLAISREICRLSGGDLTVESVLGEGSTFIVRIPGGVASNMQMEPGMAHIGASSSRRLD